MKKKRESRPAARREGVVEVELCLNQEEFCVRALRAWTKTVHGDPMGLNFDAEEVAKINRDHTPTFAAWAQEVSRRASITPPLTPKEEQQKSGL